MEIALVGNPNCGKTTLFNALTGARQKVGNWSGVTVELKSGFFCVDNNKVNVIDLPGTYSLNIVADNVSLDERIACDYLLKHSPDLIINTIDAKHIERSMYLTMQLLEMGLPVILAINMLDVAEQENIHIDLERISKNFACPVIGLEANKGRGVSTLKQAVIAAQEARENQQITPQYNQTLEAAIAAVMASCTQLDVNHRWLAIRLLEEDAYAKQFVDTDVHELTQTMQQQLAEELREDADILLADARYQKIQSLLHDCIEKGTQTTRSLTQRIDKFVLNRVLGIPIFLAVMYSMFVFAINIGGAFQDFFDIAGDAVFVQGLGALLANIGVPNWFNGIVTAGIGLGITTTLTFIPVIGGMFLFLSFLEGSGYMARAAFIMDRLMRAIGLPGKSFVPMIVGFGCNVPSIMAARTLDNPRDRILTIMMSPFMSCGARLAIYAVFVAAFFPVGGQNVIFALYLVGILMAIGTGLLLRKTVLAGEPSPLIMELPAYHIPTITTLLLSTWQRLKSFLLKAAKVIIPLCICIGFLNALTTDGNLNFDDANQDSVLSAVGKRVTPIFEPMGIHQDNWPATVGIATGMLAKEVVVATLNTLYTQAGDLQQETDEKFNFMQSMQDAVMSVPENLGGFIGDLANPIAASAPESDVTQGVYGQMYQRFDGQVGAFAYLLFLLLYFPCVATTAVMARELNRRWTLFSVCWTTGMAYCVAVLFYQTATFRQHPQASLTWVGVIFSLFFLVIFYMRQTANRQALIAMEAGV